MRTDEMLKVQGMHDDLMDKIRRLEKENKKLRDALAPFACLGRPELTPGDFNRARRALGLNKVPA